MSASRAIELGRIGAPFGLNGWMHVSSYTDPPQALLAYRRWQLSRDGAALAPRRLIDGRLRAGRLVAQLEGIEDRDAAAELTGVSIEVEREALPPTGEREYYRADLIGLEARNVEGASLGTVACFVDAPAGAVMVLEQGGTQRWVLADPTHLLEVDLAAGRIRVDWPLELE